MCGVIIFLIVLALFLFSSYGCVMRVFRCFSQHISSVTKQKIDSNPEKTDIYRYNQLVKRDNSLYWTWVHLKQYARGSCLYWRKTRSVLMYCGLIWWSLYPFVRIAILLHQSQIIVISLLNTSGIGFTFALKVSTLSFWGNNFCCLGLVYIKVNFIG